MYVWIDRIHLPASSNPIESMFTTVRLRQRLTKGRGSRVAGIAMALKLIEHGQARWRVVNHTWSCWSAQVPTKTSSLSAPTIGGADGAVSTVERCPSDTDANSI